MASCEGWERSKTQRQRGRQKGRWPASFCQAGDLALFPSLSSFFFRNIRANTKLDISSSVEGAAFKMGQGRRGLNIGTIKRQYRRDRAFESPEGASFSLALAKLVTLSASLQSRLLLSRSSVLWGPLINHNMAVTYRKITIPGGKEKPGKPGIGHRILHSDSFVPNRK